MSGYLSRMHPFVILFAWGALVLLCGALGWPTLLPCFVVLLVLSMLMGVKAGRVLWRMRWLFASVAVLYLFGTPGDSVVASGGLLVPTWQGIAAGGEQALRLAIAIAGIALVNHLLGTGGMMAALGVLLEPFAKLGVPVERFMVRLTLTMQFAQQRVGNWRQLRAELSALGNESTGLAQTRQVQIPAMPFKSRDAIACALIAVLAWVAAS